jgi:hypothetical protein
MNTIPDEVSAITRQLIHQLIERDRKGRAKYGTSLDRSDLAPDDWAQHMAEELMDAAGYALALRREAETIANPNRLGYTPGELDRSAPARIWLQVDPEDITGDRSDPLADWSPATWCAQPVGGLEVAYVRADLVRGWVGMEGAGNG